VISPWEILARHCWRLLSVFLGETGGMLALSLTVYTGQLLSTGVIRNPSARDTQSVANSWRPDVFYFKPKSTSQGALFHNLLQDNTPTSLLLNSKLCRSREHLELFNRSSMKA
jgi:hypothetical protein